MANSIDELGRKILDILSVNPLASYREIAEELGVSHVTVSDRVAKLVNEGSVKFLTSVSPRVLNYTRGALVGLVVRPYGRVYDLLKIFENCPRVVFYSPSSGANNFLVFFCGETGSEIDCMVEKHLRPISTKIEVNTTDPPRHIPMKNSKKLTETAPCGENCRKCSFYIEKKCVGCPATKWYKIR